MYKFTHQYIEMHRITATYGTFYDLYLPVINKGRLCVTQTNAMHVYQTDDSINIHRQNQQ